MKNINFALGWAFAVSLVLIYLSKGVNKAEILIGVILLGVVLIGVLVQLWKVLRNG
jgi:hypothetical protein